MSKIKNIFITLVAAAALCPAGISAQTPTPLDQSSPLLANGSTAYITATPWVWQNNEWQHENNIAKDPDGNIYMAGTFKPDMEAMDTDLYIRKLSPNGVVLWTSTVTSPGYDYARSVSYDGAGNLYVLAVINPSTQDIAVAKYDAATGNQLWARIYDSGDYSDNAYDITADVTGAYVAGTSQNDIALIKFSADNLAAPVIVLFDGGYSNSSAYGIAMRDNVIALAGSIYSDTYGNEIWVAKYAKDTLAHVWASTYTSANHPQWGYDEAHGVKIDLNGNIYAAGYYYNYDSGTDIWLGKYDAGGNLIFAKTKNGPSNGYDKGFGLALDGFGNIYVTGKTEAYSINQGDNIWLGKYSPSGALLSELSTHRNYEVGYDVEVTTSLVVVAGGFDENYGLVNVYPEQFGAPQQLFAGPGWYTGSVNLNWVMENPGTFNYRIQYATYSSVAWNVANAQIDVSTNITAAFTQQMHSVSGLPVIMSHLAGDSEPGPVYYFRVWVDGVALTNTVSAAPNAPPNWWNDNTAGQDRFWVFQNSFDGASALARDASGNTYLAYSANTGGMAITKFDQYNNPQWTSFSNYSGANSNFTPIQLQVGPAGNLYAAGAINVGFSGNTNAWVAKFSEYGVKLWEGIIDGPVSGNDMFNGLVRDASGNVYASGEVLTGSNTEMLLAKYSPLGVFQSSRTYKSTAVSASAYGLAIDASNLYVTGFLASTNGTAMDWDAAAVKYDHSLAYVGEQVYSNPAGTLNIYSGDTLAGAVIDGGYLYAAGSWYDHAGAHNSNLFAAKIDPATLAQIWSSTYNSVDNMAAGGYGIKVNAGSVYVSGYEDRAASGRNILLRKYSTDGAADWTKSLDGTYSNQHAMAFGVEPASDGYFYMSGLFNIDVMGSGNGQPGLIRAAEPMSGITAMLGPKPCSVQLSWIADTELPQGTTFYVHYATYSGVAFDDSLAQYSFFTSNYNFAGSYLSRLVPGLEAGNGAPAPGVSNVNSPRYYFKLGYKRPADFSATAVTGSTDAVANTPGLWDRMDRYPNGNLFIINNAHGERYPLVRDAAGNIYTAGTFNAWGWNTGTAYVRKFSPQGLPLWTRYYSDQYDYSTPVINALALDAAGNLYAAGSAGSDAWTNYYPYGPESETKRDALLIKYAAADGRMQWARTYDFTGAGGNDYAYGLAVGQPEIFLAGKFMPSGQAGSTGMSQAFVMALNSSGVVASSASFSASMDVVFNALAYDAVNSKLLAAGKFYAGTGYDGVVKAFNASLTDLAQDITVDRGYDDEIYSVRVDTVNAAVYMAGAVDDGMGSQDAYIAKYSAGSQDWERSYNSANQNTDEAYGLALDGLGGVYLSGSEYRYDLNQGKNLFVRKYNTAGDLIWTQAFNSASNNEDAAGGIAADTLGNVFAAVDAGSMDTATTYTPLATINGAGYFRHTQFNMNVVNPRLTVRVSSGTAAGSGLAGVRVAVMGFNQTGGIDPNGISLGTTSATGYVTMALPGGKSYFVAVSSHNMVPSIKDQLSDPGGNFFVELNADTTKQYYISPRSAAADAVHMMTVHLSSLTANDYVMGEVFINQTGERVGYSVIRATDTEDVMSVYNLPGAANGVYGIAVSVPARNKVMQLFMDGDFPASDEYSADLSGAAQLTGSFDTGVSTVPPSVAGMVMDANWSPLEGARVRIERYGCTQYSDPPTNTICVMWSPVFSKETLTDTGGSFSFYNVPFENNYNLNVGKAGYESGFGGFSLTAPTLGMAPVPYMQQFQLAVATYTLTGILKYNGVPLPNATIMVNPDWMGTIEGNDSYRWCQYGGCGVRSDARVRTGADGSFTVNGITDGNARIEAAFEGGWRSLNEGNDPESWSDNLRVTISSQGATAPLLPANNPCRPGRVWIVNSSGTCVTAGSVAFNIVPVGANTAGRLYGNVTFITTYTVTGTNPLVISTSSPLTLMAQETCDGDCKNQQMGFTSLAGSFVSDTTSYSIVLSTGLTYYPRVFSTVWAKATSFDSEIDLASTDTYRQDISVVKAGGVHGVVKLPDGTNFRPAWGDPDSLTSYWGDINVRGVNIDANEGKQINEYGEFEFPNLSPGVYSLSIRPQGAGFIWAVSEVGNISVTEGRTTEVKLQLENGLAVRPQIFGLPVISTPSWGYNIIGVESGTEMNQKKVTELFFSEPKYSFEYSTSTGWSTRYMPAGQYDFYLLMGSKYEPSGDFIERPASYQQFANFIGRVKAVVVQKDAGNPNVGTTAQPIAVNILGSVGQARIAGTVQGANMFTLPDLERMFANFNEMFPLIPAVMLYDSAGDLRGFANAMPNEAAFMGFETALMAKDAQGMLDYLEDNPMDYGIWGMPPGNYTAVFANPNYPPMAKEITLPANASYIFNFDNETVVVGDISGVVKSSATGLALPGARVYLKHRTVEKFSVTDSSGAFSFNNLPAGIYRLEVSRNGYVTVGQKTSLAGNDSVAFANSDAFYLLPSESKLTGRVFLSKFPTQITKVGVDIVAYDETMNVEAPESYLPKTEVQTDSSGNFEITGVVPGHLYKLSAFYQGKLPEVLEVTAQDGNTVISDITMKDVPPQITIKVKKSADSVNKVDVVIKSPKQLIAAPNCRFNPGEAFDADSSVTLALVPGPGNTYLGRFTISSSQQYYTVRVNAGDGGNKMEKDFVYDQVSNAKTEQYIQQESLAGGAIQMDKENEDYSGIELDPGALSYSTATSGTVDYSNLVGGFFSALPSVRTVKTDKGSLTISDAIQGLMASEVYNLDLSNASANKAFTLTLKYDKERGAGSSGGLRIYQYDEATGAWKEVPGNYTTDPMTGVVSVDVASLTNAYEGTGGVTTPLGRKRFGMSAVRNGRYVPSTTGATSQSGKFAVFTANPPTGTAAYSSAFEVYNMPNPFNLKSKSVDLSGDIGASGITDPYPTSGTVIKYNLPAGKSGSLKFVIYNLAGEKVRTLDEGSRTGNQVLYSEWDGKNDTNQDCASGVYFMLTYLDGKKLGNKAHKMAIIK